MLFVAGAIFLIAAERKTAVTLRGCLFYRAGEGGPRGGTAALVCSLSGSSAKAGVPVTFNYEIRALISVLPGAGILVARVVFKM